MEIREEHTSSDGRLRLRVVADPAGDLTLGSLAGDLTMSFDGFSGHTHADILATTSGLPEAEAARRFVADLLGDRAVIALLSGPDTAPAAWVADDPAAALAHLVGSETIELRYWSGRPWAP